MAGGTAVTVLLLTFFWIGAAWRAIGQSVSRDLLIIASRSAGEIDEYLSGKVSLLTVTRELLSYPEKDKFKLELMLKRISLEFSEFRGLALIDIGGEVIARGSDTNGSPDIAEEILTTVKNGKIYTSSFLFRENNIPYIRIALPLFWQGEVFRILVAEIDTVAVWDKVDSIKIGATAEAMILSKNEEFLAGADKGRVLKKRKWSDFIKSKTSLTEKSGSLVVKDVNGKILYAAYAEIPATGWKLVVIQERYEALHFLKTLISLAAIIIVLSLITAYFIAASLARKLSQPVAELYKGAKEISLRNFDYRVPKLDGCECSLLGEMFNSMGDSLSEYEKTKQELAKAERLAAVGRLAADVAHEINNPLAIMKNYIYIISKKRMNEDDSNQKVLGIIDREIDRVARIISSFNKFYTGTQKNTFDRVDITLPLREVIDFCRMDMKAKGISLEERPADNAFVLADRDKLKQVFLNIMKNAAEAMPNGGKVTVDARLENDKVCISMTDTGMGIKKENLGKVFDPFFSTKGIKGHGLGLSVCYGIIKNMNGIIQVESEEGKGTTFKITLPVVD